VISWRSNSLINLPWLSMFSKLDRFLTKGSWAALNLCKTFGPCWNLCKTSGLCRNHPQAFSSLGISYLLFISLYPLMASLLDVGNGVCFLEHTMVGHRTMVPI
jgi:hypothetical protein